MNLFKRAAQLRRANKKLTVQQSVKKAGAELRAKKRDRKKKVGATKFIERGEKRDAAATRIYKVKRDSGRYAGVKKIAGFPVIAGVSVSQALAQTRRVLLAEIGALEAKKFGAKLKRDKAKISRDIAAKKSLYKKLL